MIADGAAIRPWAGGPDERKRRAVLEAAKQKLESPQPVERKIKKQTLATCDWERGELIGYRLLSGDYVVLRVLDQHEDKGGVYPYCELLDWRGPEIPATGLPDTVPVRELRDYGGGTQLMIVPLGKRLLKDRLRRLNLKQALDESYARGKADPARVTSWKEFDRLLELSYQIR